MDSSVVPKPRFPRKSVDAGECFCIRRIFCADFGRDLDVFSFPSEGAVVGRPEKSLAIKTISDAPRADILGPTNHPL